MYLNGHEGRIGILRTSRRRHKSTAIKESPFHTYIADHIDAQAVEVADHVLLLGSDLGVRKQLDEVLLGDAVLDHYVQRDDAHLVVVGDVLQ